MTPEEIEKLDREVARNRETRKALRDLIESEAWKTLETIGNEQIQTRISDIILQPLESGHKAYEQEYKKGEIQGIKLFFHLPESIIESLTSEIDSITKGADDE